jgi:hypothetical protein
LCFNKAVSKDQGKEYHHDEGDRMKWAYSL